MTDPAHTSQPACWHERSGSSVRYFADAGARSASLPSYALLPGVEWTVSGSAGSWIPTLGCWSGRHHASVRLPAGTSMYACGEVAGPLLRNGCRVTCWNTDAYGYQLGDSPLYQAHPWVLCVMLDGSAIGVLADTTFRCEIDTGFDDPCLVSFAADGPSLPVIVCEGDTPAAVVRELARLTGKMPLPPLWALGYHQCRYSYETRAEVESIAAGLREHAIPADAVWIDIDAMEGFRSFTWSAERFPSPDAMNTSLREHGLRTVVIVDPAMKSPETPAVSTNPMLDRFKSMLSTGDQLGVWVRSASGDVYEGAVWGGASRFPDFTRPDVRQWWAGLQESLVRDGVGGVWNDMNEPAVFQSPGGTMPEGCRHAGEPDLRRPDGYPQAAAACDTHARYHNVYGMLMARATWEGLSHAAPDRRPFVLSRASFVGGQRYAAAWTGDNTADWGHLAASIPMVLNLGLSGQPFAGPDIGGFAGDGDAELFARWMGVGALLPFCRGHSAKGTIRKEPWAFDEATLRACREALKRRYRLLPYLYTVFWEASQHGDPVARPLFWADPTDHALRAEDRSFLLGDQVLVECATTPLPGLAPVRPRGVWREFEATTHLHLPRLLLHDGAIVPSGPDLLHTGERLTDPLTLTVNLDADGVAAGELYEDAGDGLRHLDGAFCRTGFGARVEGDQVRVSLVHLEGDLPARSRGIVARILLGDETSEATGRSGADVLVPLPTGWQDARKRTTR